jgi:sugar phosphate isomerase/epimerase
MLLPRGHHLAYCTNIHPAETWPETLAALEQYTLAVRVRVCPGRPYAIGLRLSDQASRQLSEPAELLRFRRWLERHDCYVFTINGFAFGRFHGGRVKERVYLPDWTSPERLEYTNRLFDLLAQLLPEGVAGSVSTLPGSFKEFITAPEQLAAIRGHLHACVKHISEAAARARRELHLGLEPEPLGLLETTRETVDFFDRLRGEHPGDARLDEFLGVNYDTCHLAVEFEEAAEALALLQSHRVRISKIHLSNALKLRIADCGLRIAELAAFADDIYLHQVVARNAAGGLIRCRDLDVFLNPQSPIRNPQWEEARVHFHLPLHTPPGEWFDTTSDHLLGVLDALQANPSLCSHLEMETYTWGVLPPALKSRSVVDQLAAEYEWCLRELRQRRLA